MRRLFQSFDRARVRYLLISGQASILYGAATFSEDVDVWIDPGAANVARFLRALAAVGATVYSKLTPPMTQRNVRRGHGFHYLVPDDDGPVYLDVMPRPPRVGTFAAAHRRRKVMRTSMGRIDVVAIEDLIELKKTRRLPDYAVITRLVAVRLGEASPPSRKLLEWAARNAFQVDERVAYLRRLGRAATVKGCEQKLLRDLVRLQRKDQAHWVGVIADLRTLRDRGALLPEGCSIRALLAGRRTRVRSTTPARTPRTATPRRPAPT